jgi:hypothetical protein
MEQKTVNLVINKLSKQKYNDLLLAGDINEDELYYVIDDDGTEEIYQYTQRIINDILTAYVKRADLRGELDDILPVEANPNVPSQEGLAQLDNVKIGDTVYKVNEVGDNLSLSTESARPSTPLLRKGLRTTAEPENEIYQLKTITIAGDTWSVEPDLSDYSTTTQILDEIQTSKEETEANLNYKIEELKELLGQSLNANFELIGFYDNGSSTGDIVVWYYMDPDYGNQADILCYYIYKDETSEEASILFTYI